jgi:hypothetical protein
MRRYLLPLFCLVAIVLACAQTPAAITPSVSPPALSQETSSGGGDPTFTIALEYAIPGLADAYSPTGLTYAKPQPIFGMWKFIEPEPGVYSWGALDDLVIEYQGAGFSGIQLLISAESSWASINPPSL